MGANQSWKIGLLLTSLLSTVVLGQEAPPTELSIVTYDAAHIGPKTLVRAERLAGTILGTAGILPSWNPGSLEDLGSLVTDFTAYGRQECDAEQTRAILRVQILQHPPVGLAAQALGFSLPCARRGIQVMIYADRISNVSETGGPTFGRVLGYAIAHELGHVLLQSDAHAPAGLMKGIWSKADWQRAAVSVIPFSPAEAQQIAALHKRPAETNIAQLVACRSEFVSMSNRLLTRAAQFGGYGPAQLFSATGH